MRSIFARIGTLLHTSEEQARRAVRIVSIAAAVLTAVVLIVLLVSYFAGQASVRGAYDAQQAQVEALEALYTQGDYGAMAELLDGMEDSYRAVYDKYYTVAQLHKRVTACEEDLPDTIDLIRRYPPAADLLDHTFEGLFGVLAACDDLEQAGYVYGEQDAVAQLRSRAGALLSGALHLDEEEIGRGMAAAREEEPDYTPLREAAAARIMEE